jgi:hypothetical protein
VDPVTGAAKAAEVLRPGGRLAIFGHVLEPPDDIATAFADAYGRVVPDSPFSGSGRRPLEVYQAGYARIAETLADAGALTEVEQWSFDWSMRFTREQWLSLLPTTGGLTRLSAGPLAEILDAVGAAIDRHGGAFTMDSTTLATTCVRG